MGTETTFPVDVTQPAALLPVLLEQSDRVAARMRAGGFLGRTVTLKVRGADFSTFSRSLTLDAPTDTAHDLYNGVRRLLAAVEIPSDGVRLIGVRAEGLVDASGAAVQASFDELGGPDHRTAELAVDRVRARYGVGSVRPGSLVRRPATAPAASDLS